MFMIPLWPQDKNEQIVSFINFSHSFEKNPNRS